MRLRVLEAGHVLVQDLGRPGHAGIGVPVSGAADRSGLVAANRRVGNSGGAAALEVLLGRLRLRAEDDVLVALGGAPAPAGVVGPDGRARRHDQGLGVLTLRAGSELELTTPPWGMRTYLAIRGGLVAPVVLGSSATDVLSGLGPAPVRAGHVLEVGAPARPVPTTDPDQTSGGAPYLLDVLPGPRRDWFTEAAVQNFLGQPYAVTDQGDRVGVRLRGPALSRSRAGELASEGVVRGSVQVPPDGQPLIFGPDHPVTGGYPVIGVLTEAAADAAAQLRPGQQIRFRHRRWE